MTCWGLSYNKATLFYKIKKNYFMFESFLVNCYIKVLKKGKEYINRFLIVDFLNFILF